MPLNSKTKGSKGELDAAKELSRLFGTACRRGQQYSGLEGRDVVGMDGVHVEVKRKEKMNLYTSVEQAVNDATEGDVPLVLHRRNRKPWLAIVRLDDLPTLVARLYLTLCTEEGDGK